MLARFDPDGNPSNKYMIRAPQRLVFCQIMFPVVVVITLLWLFAGFSSAQDYVPRYDAIECPFFIRRMALDHDAEITCGYLIVPEDREAIDGDRLIELFVVRIAARLPQGNTPLVFLAGGPGSPISDRIGDFVQSRLHEDFEIIAIDLRGAGFSRPSLNCHEMDDRPRRSDFDWAQECYRRLIGEGIALRAYNSANSAHDIHDLLLALKIDAANIYGVSYGSRLALTLARDFPQRIRALILDGVFPLHVNRLEAYAQNGYRAIETLLADCRNDPDCNRAYPNLSQSIYATLVRLNQEPAEFQKANMDYPIVLSGDDFVTEIYAMLYDKRLIPLLPALINAYALGDYEFDAIDVSRRLEPQTLMESEWLWEMDQLSEGMAYSVACVFVEEIPFNSRDRIVNGAASLPGPVRRPLVDMAITGITQCEAWDVPAAPDLANQPVASDIPTLLLSGRYDPVTPPGWGDEAARYLPNSWHYIFADSGHGVLFKPDVECAASIALSFLANPARQPEDACITELPLPDFYIRP